MRLASGSVMTNTMILIVIAIVGFGIDLVFFHATSHVPDPVGEAAALPE